MRSVIVHGGVSGRARSLSSIAHSLPGARGALGALDAVEAAIRALEDDPTLNAGYGSVLDRDGGLGLDAGIADGASGRCGAVAGVDVKNPITLARRVMERTPHVLMAGAGALELASGLERLTDSTPDQRARWSAALSSGELVPDRFGRPEMVDTVGAVALDAEGRLAAGSSTGGVFGKLPGRVGDAPVFGAGFYASPSAAVVGTGVGELFLSTLASYRVGRLIEAGEHPQAACEEAIGSMATVRVMEVERLSAGLLALDDRGRIGAAYRGGAWTVEGLDGPIEAVRMP